MANALGVVLSLSLLLAPAGQDKSKKTYELLYDDVQFLKQQFQRLEKRLDGAAGEIGAVASIVRDLAGQFKQFQADQARTQENIKGLPLQMQAFLDRLGDVEGQLRRIADDLAVLRARPEPAPAPEPEAAEDKPVKPEAKAAAKKKAEPASKKAEPGPDKKASDKKEPDKAPPKTNVSPQDVYNQAYADYQKGSYDLAEDGFRTYREQFSASPLADNALYMIGECFFSQKKFAQAIESFDDLIVTYPVSDKIAAAHWKKANALVELKKKDEAIAVLRLLVSKFPLEEEARSAQEKLKELQGIK